MYFCYEVGRQFKERLFRRYKISKLNELSWLIQYKEAISFNISYFFKLILIYNLQEMQNKNPEEARFLKKLEKEGGRDQDQDDEEIEFDKDLQKALNNHGKKEIVKNLQSQIQYFGNKIQPFNMREEEQMGQIDTDGFFVFSKKRNFKDAWLDSLEENDEVVDHLKKRIKGESRYRSVYQNQKEEVKDQEDAQQIQEKNQDEEEQEENDNENNPDKKLARQIKKEISQILPFNKNINQYLKQIKNEKQHYQNLMNICNRYIEITGDHQIMTMKKQVLEESSQEEQVNWNIQSEQSKKEDDQQEDNIF